MEQKKCFKHVYLNISNMLVFRNTKRLHARMCFLYLVQYKIRIIQTYYHICKYENICQSIIYTTRYAYF